MQGVGFRDAARTAGSRYNLDGWVRNEPDGSVLMEAQGTAAAIEALLADIDAAKGRGIIGRDRADLPDDPALTAKGFERR